MKKLISYEYRNNKKEFNKLVLILIAASTILQFSFLFNFFGEQLFIDNSIIINNQNLWIGTIISLIVLLFTIFIFVVSIIYFVKLANILKKDIYDGQSYIVFSLPVSGKQIIASKYLIGIYYILIMPILLFIYNIILFGLLMIISSLIDGVSWTEIVRSIRNILSSNILREILYTFDFEMIFITVIKVIIFSLFSISVIYAAVVTDWKLSKVKRNTSKWILYVILFFFIWGLIQSIFGLYSGAFNFSFYVNDATVLNYADNSNLIYNLNIYSIINIVMQLITSVGLYFYTSYIFSKKIEI